MPLFLKLVPLKVWLALAVIVALAIGGFTLYRDGERKIEAKDKALRAAAAALNKASEDLAQIKEIEIGHVYEKFVLQPAAPDAPGLVCHNTAPVKPQTTDSGPGADGKATQLPDGGFNPSGAILTLLRDDDAQINGLIDTVLNLEIELEGRSK